MKKVEEAMDHMQFSVALTAIWELVRAGNRYIEATQPWELARDDGESCYFVIGPVSFTRSVALYQHTDSTLYDKDTKKDVETVGVTEEHETSWESLYQFGVLYPVSE